jgi:ubiquinone/menaquinone biosynthesis C-methylase UbiE
VVAILDEIRRFWDTDAATYDRAEGHRPTSAAVNAAWTAALEAMLPTPPARVLDCGAGTGFLSLIAARLGHRVTALDVSEQMLARLRAAAETHHLDVEVVPGPADEPPGSFDAVMERHLLWTLPDPGAALRAWRAAAPEGRLVAIESLWGTADPLEALRARAWRAVRRWRDAPPDHHGPYPEEVRAALPLGTGTHPREVVELVSAAGWANPRLVRLRDVEWASSLELRLPERLLGVTPRFAVAAT